MNNFKMIVALMLFIAVSAVSAVVPPAVQNRINTLVSKIENDPDVTLSAPEKDILNKYIPMADEDDWIQENVVDALDQVGFVVDQLKTTAAVRKATAKRRAVKKAPPAKRTARTRKTTARKAPVKKKAPAKKVAPTKKAVSVRKEAPLTKKEAPVKRVIPPVKNVPVKNAPVRTSVKKEAPVKSSVKPSEDLAEAQKTRICDNLILFFDSNLAEKMDGKNAGVCSQFINALQDKVSPIIIASNMVENFCFWKTEYKQMLEAINQELLKTKSIDQARKKAKELFQRSKETEGLASSEGLFALMLSGVGLSGNDWDCYMHKHADLILLVPKSYRARHASFAPAGTNTDIEACGFSAASLDKITNVSPESLLKHIQTKKTKKPTNVADAVRSMFIHKNPADEKEIASWNIYINGHGSVADESVSNKGIIIPRAFVAGMHFADFSRLMAFFNNDIETNFVQYSTCFGGGHNQTFVNDVLQKLDVNFIVVAEGINESAVYGRMATFSPYKLIYSRFTQFFALLENFFGEPIKLGKKVPKGLQQDPLATIIGTITELSRVESLPFVRIPAIGVFTALNVDKKVKILTKSIVKAYELEGRTIDMAKPGIENIIVYPSFIGVPIKISQQNIISPTPQKIEQIHTSTHIFEEIIAERPLSDFIAQCVKLNSSYSKITFVIKKLTCLNYEQSGIEKNNKSLAIENMVIQIVGTMSADRMGIDAQVKGAFMCDGQTYSFALRINNLAKSGKELAATFKSLTMSTAHGDLANKFLEPTALGKLRDRSVAGIVEYFESLINKDFGVQKVGALKKVLLLKELDGLEKATEPEALQAQKEWLASGKKPGVTFATSLNRQKKEVARLKADVGKLTPAEMPSAERNTALDKIKNIETIINNELASVAGK